MGVYPGHKLKLTSNTIPTKLEQITIFAAVPCTEEIPNVYLEITSPSGQTIFKDEGGKLSNATNLVVIKIRDFPVESLGSFSFCIRKLYELLCA